MKYKIAIIDDCLCDILKLKQLLQQYNELNGMTFYITTFNNNEYEQLISTEYDLYFLDIDMPNKGGFEIARTIEKINSSCKIVFCSFKDDLVFQSLSNNIFFFIRKSYFIEDFNNFIIKLTDSLEFENFYVCGDRKIYFKNILYVESCKHYVLIHLKNYETIKERINIKHIINQFEDNYFVNVDNGVLVNLSFIKRINYVNNKIVLINDNEVDISLRKVKEVKTKYHKFLAGC